ncbi:MAG: hypothetical protein CMP07_06245 [Xanthomonadales bacterium]|nr:hypothetical protein [Xanthomonadales bacterium]
MQVLVELASRPDRVVTRRHLEDVVWPGMIVTDDALSRCIYQLRQTIDSLLPAARKSAVIETLRKRGYRLALPVKALAEVTEAGTDCTPDNPVPGKPAAWMRSRSAVLLAALILLGVVLMVNTANRRNPATAALPASVAVLPFLNLTGDPGLEAVADGFTEQLSHDLANVPGLRVAARTSSFFFKDKSIQAHEIAERMGVDSLIEGSLRQGEGGLRVTVQLIEKDGFHAWSGEYDRALNDPLRMQSNISRNVLAALGWRNPGPSLQLPSESIGNFEAYDRYLRGRIRMARSDGNALDDAMALFREALDLESDYAPAYTGLADAWSLGICRRSVDRDAAIGSAEDAIRRAMAIDGKLAEAHASRGLLHFCLNEYQQAEAPLRRALELNPNYLNAHIWLGLSLVYQDRFNEAADAYLHAQERDPMDDGLNRNLGANLLLSGQPDAGFSYLRRAQAIDPTAANTYLMLGGWNRIYGNPEQSLDWSRQGLERYPENLALLTGLGATHLQLGNFERAEELFEQASALDPGDVTLLSNRFHLYLAGNDISALDRLLSQQDFRDGRSRQDLVLLKWEFLRALIDNDFEVVISSAAGWEGSEALACNAFMEPGARLYLAFALRESGDTASADTIVRECREKLQQTRANGARYPKLAYRSALLALLAGDHDAAARELAQAYEMGWRDCRQAWNDPLWREHRMRPEFKRIFDSALAEMTEANPIE